MLTSEQKTIIPPAYRQGPPFQGLPNHTIPTSVWFEHFIIPAQKRGVNLRIVAEGNIGSSHFLRLCNDLGVKPDLATIINGSGEGGKGVLYSVRRGDLPAMPVFAEQWFHEVMGEVGKDDPSRNQVRKEMVYDGWKPITSDMIQRGLLHITPALKMLLGSP